MKSEGLQEYMLPCLNKKIFGIDCMGCGLQRSVALLFQGEFTEAFYMFPAIYPMLILLVFVVLNLFIKIKYASQIKIALVIFAIAVVVVSYFIKMSRFF